MTRTAQVSTHSLFLSDREIRYELTRKKVKNINIRVHADGTVHVSANAAVPMREIEAVLLKKATFLLRALDRFAERKAPAPLSFTDGERIPLLGEEKILRVVLSTKNSVTEEDDALILAVREPDNIEFKRRVLMRYTDRLCKKVVTAVCHHIYPLFLSDMASTDHPPADFPFPTIRFRVMRSRWGSCRPKTGVLTFNTRLVFHPIPCIEYVVMHEFTHFLHPDHSARFYQALTMRMPDFKERKALLDSTPVFI